MDIKERIIEGSTELFKTYGIKSVTMDSIASNIGISKRTIYEIFSDKDELLMAASATRILGMLPLAISKGSCSELWSPMGVAVIGGLVFSTMVTLVLVPVVYAMFAKRGERNKNLAVYSEFDFMNGNETKQIN